MVIYNIVPVPINVNFPNVLSFDVVRANLKLVAIKKYFALKKQTRSPCVKPINRAPTVRLSVEA